MGDVFVGIVESTAPFTVTVGVAQSDPARVTAQRFAIAPSHLHEYYVPEPGGRHRYDMPDDLFALGRFLNETIAPDSRVRYLLEVPEAVPHPADKHDAVPHPVLSANSVILKVLVMLGVNDVVVAPMQTDPEVQTVVVFPILRGGELEHLRERSPRYLLPGICKAYGELLGLACNRSEYVAIAGALIAKHSGAYHYWSSIGRVQSSQDIVTDFRNEMHQPTRVVSASEHYTTDYTDATIRDGIEDIPLEYAVTEKRYAHLGPDAIKAALIQVCKQWRIGLRCRSRRPDADDDSEDPVHPLPVDDQLMIASLEHAARERIWPEPG
jgi:hypothetical protein